MKYDVYEGSKADFDNSNGNLWLKNLTKKKLQLHLTIKEAAKALKGELIPSWNSGNVIWVEEAM